MNVFGGYCESKCNKRNQSNNLLASAPKYPLLRALATDRNWKLALNIFMIEFEDALVGIHSTQAVTQKTLQSLFPFHYFLYFTASSEPPVTLPLL